MAMIKKILALKYILLLDFLLLALCVWMGFQVRRQWVATAEANQLWKIVPPTVAMQQAMRKQSSPEALQKNYMVIASRNLFSPDRNDQVAREDQAKTRPPKPILFGVMNLPDAKMALMAPPNSRNFRPMKEGEKIGEYTLTRIFVNKVELQYGNETFETTTEEQPVQVAAPFQGATAGSGPRVVSMDSSGSMGSTAANSTASAEPPQPTTPCKGKWVKTLFGWACTEDKK